MKRLFLLSTVLLLSFFWVACKKKYPPTPEIEFLSISKNFLSQNGADSLQIKFSFVDGDGDIGNETTDNVFVYDARTEQLIATYRIPEYTENTKYTYRKGEIALIVYSQCCIYPDSSQCYANSTYPLDSMTYLIKVQDKTGNFSNTIETDIVQLDCEG